MSRIMAFFKVNIIIVVFLKCRNSSLYARNFFPTKITKLVASGLIWADAATIGQNPQHEDSHWHNNNNNNDDDNNNSANNT